MVAWVAAVKASSTFWKSCCSAPDHSASTCRCFPLRSAQAGAELAAPPEPGPFEEVLEQAARTSPAAATAATERAALPVAVRIGTPSSRSDNGVVPWCVVGWGGAADRG